MAAPQTSDELARGIEALVAGHLSHTEITAQEALQRAFAGARAPKRRRARPPSPAPNKARHNSRRSPEEIATIADRLCAAVVEHPGEAMVVFADLLETPAKDLHRPMSVLKKQGRIRSTGSKPHTRYFPLPSARAQE